MTMVAGIDVGKANLDVSVSGGPVLRFDNTATGITKLRKHLQEHDTTLAVCEPTGGYERLLTSRLRETDIAVHVVHPGRVRAFAMRLRGQDRSTGRPGTLPLRGGVSGGGYPETTRSVKSCLLRRRRQFVDQRVQVGAAGQGHFRRYRQVHQAPHCLAGEGDRSAGEGIPGSPTGQCHARRPRRPLPHRARHRAANRGNPGGSPSRTGPLG